jgi:hypothetical protein
MEVSGQLHTMAYFTSRERAPQTYLIGCWVGPTISPDSANKISNYFIFARFQVSVVMKILVIVFWLVTPCSN